MNAQTAADLWIFDVDACLVDSLTSTSVRPGATALLGHLRAAGAGVVLWSAGGDDYAGQRAVDLGFDHLIDVFAGKDERGPDGRYVADHILAGRAGTTRVVFVDDRPEDMPLGATVVAVSPYIAPNTHDRGLAPVMRAAGLPEDDTSRRR